MPPYLELVYGADDDTLNQAPIDFYDRGKTSIGYFFHYIYIIFRTTNFILINI